jgi:hypothetical protein
LSSLGILDSLDELRMTAAVTMGECFPYISSRKGRGLHHLKQVMADLLKMYRLDIAMSSQPPLSSRIAALTKYATPGRSSS